MATDSAAPSRQLWQLPVFLLGVAALFGVWYGRPYWRVTPAQQFEQNLAALRQAMEKVPVDASQVQTLLRKVQGIDPPPQLEQQVPFVVGSGLVFQAEASPPSPETDEQWQAARKLLESADEKGLAESDRARRQFRLARSWAHTGEPAAKVIELLAKSLNCGDDPSEGNRLLAELYRKLEPPETKKARDCLREYLTRVAPGRGEQQQRQQNEARLMLGAIHTELGETEEARKVLEKIGPDAPPELLVDARLQLGKSFALEEDWPQAVRCLEQARDVRGGTPAQKGAVLYQLSEYYLRNNHKDQAIATLDRLRKNTGPEGQAAGLKLAELQLRDPKKKDEAARTLENALGGIQSPEMYQNQLLKLAEARAIFEEATLKFRAAKAFDLSLRVARAYAKIAEPGRDHELAAEAMQAWGQSLLDQAPTTDPEDRPRLVADGEKRLRDAAKEWHLVAASKKNSLAKGDALLRAADLYLKLNDNDQTLKELDELGLKVPDFPQERMVSVWLKKGEVYLTLDNREQARICFQNGIQIAEQYPSSPSLLQCRIRLAEVLLRSSDPKTLAHAIVDLEKALADPKFPDGNKELHEGALLFVADAYYRQKDYRKAAARFEGLLSSYPESSRAIGARFQLGQCYWFIAGQEADKCKNARKVIDDPASADDLKRDAQITYDGSYKLYMDWLKKAAVPFKAVESDLLKKETADGKLSTADAELLRKTSLAAADCAFYLGEYKESVAGYDAVATRCAGTVAQLAALQSIYKCYQYYLQDPVKTNETLKQMQTAFASMPETEFDNSSDARRREYWQRWFDTVSPMKK
jgi:hypothetical protein